MSKKPDADLKRLCEAGLKAVELARYLVPMLEDHASRSDGIHFPVSGSGGGGGGRHGYSDPVLAAVSKRYHLGPDSDDQPDDHPPIRLVGPAGPVAHLIPRDFRGGPFEEQHDHEAVQAVRDAFVALHGAAQELRIRALRKYARALKVGDSETEEALGRALGLPRAS